MVNNQIPDYLNKIPLFMRRISQQYHQQTKMRELAHLPSPDEWPEVWKKVFFKAYPRLPAFKLPKPMLNSRYSFKKSLYARHSVREFSNKPLNTNQISNLLFFSCGIRNPNPTWTGNRFYPSAGARYPLEVYPVILNAKSIKTGIYHYHLKMHALEELLIEKSVKRGVMKLFDAQWMRDVGMVIVISAVFYRNQVKYGERGYRHILTEAGHLCQNIYLLCPTFGLGCCNSGGFLDDEWNTLIDIDGLEESVISVMFVGHPK